MDRSYSIDHRILFLFGYLFYLFTPIVLGRADLFDGLPGISLYQQYYDAIPKEKINSYLLISLSWLPAFLLGHYTFGLIRPQHLSIRLFSPRPVTYATGYVGVLMLGVLMVFAYLARASLFSGYATYDIAARGKLSTLLVVFNFFLLYQLVTKQPVSFAIILGTLLTSLLLLSMGGRMYVFQTFIVLLVYKTSFAPKKWRLWKIMLVMPFALMVAAAAGIWRMGNALSWHKALYSILAEPVFTWFSTSTFLSSNDIPFVQFPSNFLTSFLNMVPNTVVNLQRFVITTKQMGFSYENPLGAESAWSTFIINFGSLGTCVFLFFTGFLLNLLKSISSRSRMGAVYYILVCGMLPFQFFRDGFYILNKQLVFNFFVFPGLILLILSLLEYTQERLAAPSRAL